MALFRRRGDPGRTPSETDESELETAPTAAPAAPSPSELAEEYEALRVGFTAAVSHELRTPLARLLALLESAELRGADPQDLLDRARREVEEMRELVDDILFLSELEQRREVVSLGATAAAPVLRTVAQSLGASAERAGISIALAIEDESIELPLRARMLQIVVENLAENAVRHAGEGATLTLGLRREGHSSILEARDDGAGVAENDLPRLFERFYRADRARTTRGGTGLGLAIVKHVVVSAGGRVEALGGPARGLEIRCVFPD